MKKGLYIAVIAISCIQLLIICIISAVFVFIKTSKKYTTTNINDYGNYQGSLYYDVCLFPDILADKNKVIEYKYIYIESFLDDDQYIYLTYQYDNDYEEEKKRISSIKNEYGTVTYNTSIFNLPAYIYLLNSGDNSEFALIDDTAKRITYVYVQCPFDFSGEKYVNYIYDFNNHEQKTVSNEY